MRRWVKAPFGAFGKPQAFGETRRATSTSGAAASRSSGCASGAGRGVGAGDDHASRYPPMTFEGDGGCVSTSPTDPTVRRAARSTRAYPTEEHSGVVWVYMGDDQLESLLDALPYANELFAEEHMFVHRIEREFSHLATLDNDIDLAHPSILHHSCVPFSSPKPTGVATSIPATSGDIAGPLS